MSSSPNSGDYFTPSKPGDVGKDMEDFASKHFSITKGNSGTIDTANSTVSFDYCIVQMEIFGTGRSGLFEAICKHLAGLLTVGTPTTSMMIAHRAIIVTCHSLSGRTLAEFVWNVILCAATQAKIANPKDDWKIDDSVTIHYAHCDLGVNYCGMRFISWTSSASCPAMPKI